MEKIQKIIIKNLHEAIKEAKRKDYITTEAYISLVQRLILTNK